MSDFLNNFPEFVFMGSVLWFYILTIVFLIILFVSEVNENGYYALFSFVVFSLAMRFWGNFDIVEYVTLTMLGIYLAIGLVHSFIRTYFYGRKRGIARKEIIGSGDSVSEGAEEFQLKRFDNSTKNKLKGNVFRWWFLFPISLLTWIFSDLLKDFFNLVYDNLKKLYEYVLDLGLKSIK